MHKELLDYLPEFISAWLEQLVKDQERWGDREWRRRGRDGQEQRFFDWIENKKLEYITTDKPFPWLKVAGEALICWVRENRTDWQE